MAKHISEVEDGFALKRQRDKGKKRKVKGECTIPSPQNSQRNECRQRSKKFVLFQTRGWDSWKTTSTLASDGAVCRGLGLREFQLMRQPRSDFQISHKNWGQLELTERRYSEPEKSAAGDQEDR
jgi:hypothetical protein